MGCLYLATSTLTAVIVSRGTGASSRRLRITCCSPSLGTVITKVSSGLVLLSVQLEPQGEEDVFQRQKITRFIINHSANNPRKIKNVKSPTGRLNALTPRLNFSLRICSPGIAIFHLLYKVYVSCYDFFINK
ncbi:hypothetical protein PoB_005914700 [Plakobranchus ocellatus]|uniref:Uncharacterized protein n=1 Tax=Plakobranchus ocellatus TaxID=259542 RepID=A0AAV4CM32_9GAST|nr:hypothetical protein PoB_005914700 [Plakobranchus ocellatus]